MDDVVVFGCKHACHEETWESLHSDVFDYLNTFFVWNGSDSESSVIFSNNINKSSLRVFLI